MTSALSTKWSTADAQELYGVSHWGGGYFSISDEGHVLVHPRQADGAALDLNNLIDDLQHRGLELPILFRFNDIIADRQRAMHDAFQNSIADCGYTAGYRCVYPIKVNQQRHVAESVWKSGREFGFGLEAGSKPELLTVVAMSDAETPIICNGFKDDEFIEMAMLAQKIGRTVIPVVEKASELDLILRYAESVGVRPRIGVRVKLAARGSGRWQSSGGYRSKFGLTVSEVTRALAKLQERDMADCLQLLHFHMGSQITNIRVIKQALIEAARVYVDLHRRGAGLKYIDVGGGLGVDYDGSRTNFQSSMNYSLQEYANDVVYHLQQVCDDAEVPHPEIISESGRALVAHHSVLVFNVLGVGGVGLNGVPESVPEDYEQPIHDLFETYRNLTQRNLQESFHDAQQTLDMAVGMFASGYLSLDQRSMAEDLYWATCRQIHQMVRELSYVPEELQALDALLADTYFCNFSLFQSLPDSWAINQLFPIMPLSRLTERPTRKAVLGDITCDSDGKIDQFIDLRDVNKTLPLHEFDGSPYYLGAFLVGAYQETLGDLHNLFGDTHAVHIRLDEAGNAEVESVVKGDTIREVLSYVQYQETELVDRVQASVEKAIREGLLTNREAGRMLKCYEQGLASYTYLGQPIEE